MPRMDGFDLIRSLRSAGRTRGIPVIVITSRTAEKHRELALSLGANAFLGKPYKEDELLAYVARLLRGEPIPGDPLAETIVAAAPILVPNSPWPRGIQ
jgi:chemosensory pili system protein ChpA (sensor histidine kinase/response regulator)